MSVVTRIVRLMVLVSALLISRSLEMASAESIESADKTGSAGQLTIRLVKLPANTPHNAAIYLSGDFNSWTPFDERYRLTRDSQGQFGITLPITLQDLSKFRLTLGDAPAPVEMEANGADSSNRQYLIMEPETGTVYVAIQFWRDRSVQVVRRTNGQSAAPNAARSGFSNEGLFEKNLGGFLALGFVIIIPGIFYIRHLKRREQVLLSAIEVTSLAEHKGNLKDLSEAIATLRSNSKELERWSRAVER